MASTVTAQATDGETTAPPATGETNPPSEETTAPVSNSSSEGTTDSGEAGLDDYVTFVEPFTDSFWAEEALGALQVAYNDSKPTRSYQFNATAGVSNVEDDPAFGSCGGYSMCVHLRFIESDYGAEGDFDAFTLDRLEARPPVGSNSLNLSETSYYKRQGENGSWFDEKEEVYVFQPDENKAPLIAGSHPWLGPLAKSQGVNVTSNYTTWTFYPFESNVTELKLQLSLKQLFTLLPDFTGAKDIRNEKKRFASGDLNDQVYLNLDIALNGGYSLGSTFYPTVVANFGSKLFKVKAYPYLWQNETSDELLPSNEIVVDLKLKRKLFKERMPWQSFRPSDKCARCPEVKYDIFGACLDRHVPTTDLYATVMSGVGSTYNTTQAIRSCLSEVTEVYGMIMDEDDQEYVESYNLSGSGSWNDSASDGSSGDDYTYQGNSTDDTLHSAWAVKKHIDTMLRCFADHECPVTEGSYRGNLLVPRYKPMKLVVHSSEPTYDFGFDWSVDNVSAASQVFYFDEGSFIDTPNVTHKATLEGDSMSLGLEIQVEQYVNDVASPIEYTTELYFLNVSAIPDIHDVYPISTAAISFSKHNVDIRFEAKPLDISDFRYIPKPSYLDLDFDFVEEDDDDPCSQCGDKFMFCAYSDACVHTALSFYEKITTKHFYIESLDPTASGYNLTDLVMQVRDQSDPRGFYEFSRLLLCLATREPTCYVGAEEVYDRAALHFHPLRIHFNIQQYSDITMMFDDGEEFTFIELSNENAALFGERLMKKLSTRWFANDNVWMSIEQHNNYGDSNVYFVLNINGYLGPLPFHFSFSKGGEAHVEPWRLHLSSTQEEGELKYDRLVEIAYSILEMRKDVVGDAVDFGDFGSCTDCVASYVECATKESCKKAMGELSHLLGSPEGSIRSNDAVTRWNLLPAFDQLWGRTTFDEYMQVAKHFLCYALVEPTCKLDWYLNETHPTGLSFTPQGIQIELDINQTLHAASYDGTEFTHTVTYHTDAMGAFLRQVALHGLNDTNVDVWVDVVQEQGSDTRSIYRIHFVNSLGPIPEVWYENANGRVYAVVDQVRDLTLVAPYSSSMDIDISKLQHFLHGGLLENGRPNLLSGLCPGVESYLESCKQNDGCLEALRRYVTYLESIYYNKPLPVTSEGYYEVDLTWTLQNVSFSSSKDGFGVLSDLVMYLGQDSACTIPRDDMVDYTGARFVFEPTVYRLNVEENSNVNAYLTYNNGGVSDSAQLSYTFNSTSVDLFSNELEGFLRNYGSPASRTYVWTSYDSSSGNTTIVVENYAGPLPSITNMHGVGAIMMPYKLSIREHAEYSDGNLQWTAMASALIGMSQGYDGSMGYECESLRNYIETCASRPDCQSGARTHAELLKQIDVHSAYQNIDGYYAVNISWTFQALMDRLSNESYVQLLEMYTYADRHPSCLLSPWRDDQPSRIHLVPAKYTLYVSEGQMLELKYGLEGRDSARDPYRTFGAFYSYNARSLSEWLYNRLELEYQVSRHFYVEAAYQEESSELTILLHNYLGRLPTITNINTTDVASIKKWEAWIRISEADFGKYDMPETMMLQPLIERLSSLANGPMPTSSCSDCAERYNICLEDADCSNAWEDLRSKLNSSISDGSYKWMAEEGAVWDVTQLLQDVRMGTNDYYFKLLSNFVMCYTDDVSCRYIDGKTVVTNMNIMPAQVHVEAQVGQTLIIEAADGIMYELVMTDNVDDLRNKVYEATTMGAASELDLQAMSVGPNTNVTLTFYHYLGDVPKVWYDEANMNTPATTKAWQVHLIESMHSHPDATYDDFFMYLNGAIYKPAYDSGTQHGDPECHSCDYREDCAVNENCKDAALSLHYLMDIAVKSDDMMEAPSNFFMDFGWAFQTLHKRGLASELPPLASLFLCLHDQSVRCPDGRLGGGPDMAQYNILGYHPAQYHLYVSQGDSIYVSFDAYGVPFAEHPSFTYDNFMNTSLSDLSNRISDSLAYYTPNGKINVSVSYSFDTSYLSITLSEYIGPMPEIRNEASGIIAERSDIALTFEGVRSDSTTPIDWNDLSFMIAEMAQKHSMSMPRSTICDASASALKKCLSNGACDSVARSILQNSLPAEHVASGTIEYSFTSMITDWRSQYGSEAVDQFLGLLFNVMNNECTVNRAMDASTSVQMHATFEIPSAPLSTTFNMAYNGMMGSDLTFPESQSMLEGYLSNYITQDGAPVPYTIEEIAATDSGLTPTFRVSFSPPFELKLSFETSESVTFTTDISGSFMASGDSTSVDWMNLAEWFGLYSPVMPEYSGSGSGSYADGSSSPIDPHALCPDCAQLMEACTKDGSDPDCYNAGHTILSQYLSPADLNYEYAPEGFAVADLMERYATWDAQLINIPSFLKLLQCFSQYSCLVGTHYKEYANPFSISWATYITTDFSLHIPGSSETLDMTDVASGTSTENTFPQTEDEVNNLLQSLPQDKYKRIVSVSQPNPGGAIDIVFASNPNDIVTFQFGPEPPINPTIDAFLRSDSRDAINWNSLNQWFEVPPSNELSLFDQIPNEPEYIWDTTTTPECVDACASFRDRCLQSFDCKANVMDMLLPSLSPMDTSNPNLQFYSEASDGTSQTLYVTNVTTPVFDASRYQPIADLRLLSQPLFCLSALECNLNYDTDPTDTKSSLRYTASYWRLTIPDGETLEVSWDHRIEVHTENGFDVSALENFLINSFWFKGKFSVSGSALTTGESVYDIYISNTLLEQPTLSVSGTSGSVEITPYTFDIVSHIESMYWDRLIDFFNPV